MSAPQPRRRGHSAAVTFAAPAAIAVFSIVGLVSALTGDGWRDLLSWLALAVPVVAIAWAMRARRS